VIAPALDATLDLPLGRIPGLSDSSQQRALVQRLAQLGITDHAQLFGLLSVEEARAALGQSIGLALPQVMGVWMASRMALGQLAEQLSPPTRAWPIGATDAADQRVELVRQLDALNYPKPGQKGVARIHDLTYSLQPQRLPAGLSWRPHLPAIRDQGTRATAPAFALTAANELMRRQIGKEVTLSEQFLFYEAKQLDQAAGRTGSPTSLAAAAWVLFKHGQCRAGSWPYSPMGATADHGTKPLNARSEAGNFRCRPQVAELSVQNIKAELEGGSLVALTLPVYASWLRSAEVVRSGRLTLPLSGEPALGLHAMVAVGYDDSLQVLHLRNSWGELWARQSPIAPGYALLPYGYLAHAIEAYTLEPGV